MLDKIFAAIGMLALIAFMGVVLVFVMEPDLWIVTVLVLGIGILFLWQDIKPGGGKAKPGDQGGSKD